jgi:hypothetical protein
MLFSYCSASRIFVFFDAIIPGCICQRWLLPVVCIVALLLEGCSPLVFTSGGGNGSAASKPKHRNAVEAFFDDLGQSIKQTTRRLTGTGGEGRKRTATKAQSGLTLKVLQASLEPAKVHSGEQVKVVLQYSIAGAPAAGVALQEKTSLQQGDKLLVVLKEETSSKENGKWENTLSFAVPKSAQAGTYTVKLRLIAQGKSRTVQRSFSVY